MELDFGLDHTIFRALGRLWGPESSGACAYLIRYQTGSAPASWKRCIAEWNRAQFRTWMPYGEGIWWSSGAPGGQIGRQTESVPVFQEWCTIERNGARFHTGMPHGEGISCALWGPLVKWQPWGWNWASNWSCTFISETMCCSGRVEQSSILDSWRVLGVLWGPLFNRDSLCGTLWHMMMSDNRGLPYEGYKCICAGLPAAALVPKNGVL